MMITLQRNIKKIVLVISLVLVIGMLASCGATVIEKQTIAAGVSTVDVTGSCDMKVADTKITVTGETSFITGTIIEVSVVAQSGMIIDSIDIFQ